MTELTYRQGNILEAGEDYTVIAHVVNDLGVMRAGVAKVLYEKWPQVRESYLKCYESRHHEGLLGKVNYVPIGPEAVVANMFAQHRIKGREEDRRPPIRYGALSNAMSSVAKMVELHHSIDNISAPMFGAGLAGGDWDVVEQLIYEHWIDQDIPVTIYQHETG